MRALETIARCMARIEYRARFGDYGVARKREPAWIDKNWPGRTREAADLIRSLKGQPPHVTDACVGADFSDGCGNVLDAMLEAMARS